MGYGFCEKHFSFNYGTKRALVAVNKKGPALQAPSEIEI